jgi:hypothetical protein
MSFLRRLFGRREEASDAETEDEFQKRVRDLV